MRYNIRFAIEDLLPVSLKKDEDIHFKSRILVGIILTYSGICLLTNVYLLFLAPLPFRSVFLSILLVSFLLVFYVLALFLICYKGLFKASCHMVIGSSLAAILAGVIMSGGPLVSPAMILVIIPLLIAYVLLGREPGIYWTLAIVACHGFLLLLEFFEFSYPQLLRMEYFIVHHTAHWMVIYLAAAGVMIIYAMINARLAADRDLQRSRLMYLAKHDGLTNLHNRDAYNEHLHEALIKARTNKSQFAVLFLDLDGFKAINDDLGHSVGDRVLKLIGQRLQEGLRKADRLARIGGDEFALIIDSVDNENDVIDVVNKLAGNISWTIDGIDSGYKIGASIGIALYPRHAHDGETLLRYADIAMYHAKKTGSGHCFFSTDLL